MILRAARRISAIAAARLSAISTLRNIAGDTMSPATYFAEVALATKAEAKPKFIKSFANSDLDGKSDKKTP